MAGAVVVKWEGREYSIPTDATDDVASLKRKLQADTGVLVKRQKILGLKTKGGTPAPDEHLLSALPLKPGTKLMLLGKREEVIEATDTAAEVAPHVQDDFDDVTPAQLQQLDPRDDPENQEKLQRRIQTAAIQQLNPPRPGKKCLVLDIDYTLFDMKSVAERPDELARPYLHHMLTAVYPHYDIIIWSATSMKWIQVKMKELGVSTHPDYKLTAFLDHQSMVSVRKSSGRVFDCKPLPLLWARFPDAYNSDNTIMFDDLRRNYVFNRQNGLVIRPFKHAHFTRDSDDELLRLTAYLLAIAPLPSLGHLDHAKWEAYRPSAREQ